MVYGDIVLFLLKGGSNAVRGSVVVEAEGSGVVGNGVPQSGKTKIRRAKGSARRA